MSITNRSKEIFIKFYDDLQASLELQKAFTDLTQLYPIARAVDDELPDTDEWRLEVRSCCDKVLDLMWLRPGMSTRHVPAAFWRTDLGNLCLHALLWANRDELITFTQAAEILHCRRGLISQYLVRGRLTRYEDPTEFNPQRRTRLLRSEVLALLSKQENMV